MLAIFVMNASIGIKICQYTGRTIDRTSSSSADAAAVVTAAVAARGGLGGSEASHSVDDLYSNGSTLHKYQMRHIRAADDDVDAGSARHKLGGRQLYVSSVVGGGGALAVQAAMMKAPSQRPTSPEPRVLNPRLYIFDTRHKFQVHMS